MGRIILTPSGPRHPLEARAPAVRNEATVIILLAVHSSIYWKVTVSDPLGLQVANSHRDPFPPRRPDGGGQPLVLTQILYN